MSDIIWNTPLQFKVVGNFLQIINKENTFRFNEMVKGNPRNKYMFVPVSACSDVWTENILDDYSLNYGVVSPLKYRNRDGEESDCEYGYVELLAEDVGDGGIVVSVLGQSPAILIGDDTQEFKGVFLVNQVTGAVLAYCILTETVDVTEYLVFAYQDYILEINNNQKVIHDTSIIESLPSFLDVDYDSTDVVVGDEVPLTITATTDNSNPLVGYALTVYIDDNPVDTLRTDENGQVTYDCIFMDAGVHTIQIKLAGSLTQDDAQTPLIQFHAVHETGLLALHDGNVVLDTTHSHLNMDVDSDTTDIESEFGTDEVDDVAVEDNSDVVVDDIEKGE